MGIYFETYEQFKQSGGLKASTITAKQLLPAVVAHMTRMDRKFTLQVNGRLPKSMDALLDEVFALCHLQQPFYTQHCASRHSRYVNVSKNRVKIDFTMKYRMTRAEEKWVLAEIRRVLDAIVQDEMTVLQKIITVHDYIIRAYDYELQTEGSPFTVYTFMHERQGVCMAYALLFEKMMEQLGIPCLYVVGKADGESDAGHAWNMVQLDGEWYHIDATWNDLGKRVKGHEIRYRLFLRSDEFMKQDHQWKYEHYPICNSERFCKLSNVYDAALIGDVLYFPHPKTAYLTGFHIEKEQFHEMVSVRVQLCTAFEGQLYMSNYDDRGYLYRMDSEMKELHLVEAKKVVRLYTDEQQFVATFEGGESFTLQKNEREELQGEQQLKTTVVPLIGFGDSWFGTYEGELAAVAFTSEDGVVITVPACPTQLTVHAELYKGLDITVTSNRKPYESEQPIALQLPLAIVGNVSAIKQASGQPLPFQLKNDTVHVHIQKSTTLRLE